jgi:hypothetical protein
MSQLQRFAHEIEMNSRAAREKQSLAMKIAAEPFSSAFTGTDKVSD